MADSELNILVKVSGQGDFNKLIDKIKDGTASIDEQTKAIQLGTKMYKSWGAENQALKEGMAQTISTIKDMKEKAVEPLVGAHGKMMKSYFTLGEQLRRYYMEQRIGNRTMSEVTRTASEMGQMFGADKLGSIVGNLTNQFQQMEFAISALGIAAKQGNATMQSFGAQLMAIAPYAAAAAAAIGAGIMVIQAQKQAIDDLNKSFERSFELLTQLKRISPEEQRKMLGEQRKGLGKEGLSMQWSALIPGAGKEIAITNMLKEINDLKNKGLEIDIKDAAAIKEQLALESQRTKLAIMEEEMWENFYAEQEETTKKWRVLQAEIAKNRYIPITEKAGSIEQALMTSPVLSGMKKYVDERKKLSVLSPQARMMLQRQEFEQYMKEGQAGLKPVELKEKGTLDYMVKEMTELENKGNIFTDTLTDGIMNATNVLAQGFTSSFKLGDSLLGQFAASMLATFTQIGTKALIGKVFSKIPGFGFLASVFPFAQGGIINEPVLGVGAKSKSAYLFGEAGAEMVTPINRVGQSGRYSGMSINPSVSVHPIVNNSGLAVQVEIGNAQNKRKRL